MKKSPLLLLFLAIVTTGFSQVPYKMSYQAVVRNANGSLVVNQTVGMRVSILQGSFNGNTVYSETLSPITNGNGLITIELGNGDLFANIQWNDGPYFIKTEIDPSGGVNYTISGTTQLLSVPYALHAKSAERITGQIDEVDPAFNSSAAKSITQQKIDEWDAKVATETDPVFNGSASKLITTEKIEAWNSKLSTENDPVFNNSAAKNITAQKITEWDSKLDVEVDGDMSNEIQTLSVSYLGDTLRLSKSNYVIVPGISLQNNPNNGWQAGEVWVDLHNNISYNTVVIGTQTWMKENLRATKYNDGNTIPIVTASNEWQGLANGALCSYNNDAANDAVYGKLYNWAVVNSGKLCPTGWHVPSTADWQTMVTFLGGVGVAGGKLKEAGNTHWTPNNFGANNSSGFTGLPGGFRTSDGFFFGLNQNGSMWSSTEHASDNTRAMGFELVGGNFEAPTINNNKKNGFSVRCIKD